MLQRHVQHTPVKRDATELAELGVLATVLAIAATASYLHLREVWEAAGAPIPTAGPLLVDGLFAAAWLRMRRRRLAGVAVGWLAWAALLLALAATVAGNLAAAWISGHRDPLSLMVASWPAIAFALVWELATGHGSAPRQAAPVSASSPPHAAQEPVESWEEKRDRLLDEGAGRPQLVAELGVSQWEARKLLAARSTEQEGSA